MSDILDKIFSVEETEPDQSDPAVAIPRMINSIVADMDELCAAALRSETAHIVANDKFGIGQIKSRAELVLSFLKAKERPPLKVVGRAQ